LELLTGIAGIESPTHDKAALDGLADHLTGLLTEGGWQVTRHPQQTAGDPLQAVYRGRAGGPRTLVLCHFDTVWPVGTLADMPVRLDGDRLHGPGVLDMKAGIAATIHAVELIRTAGLETAGDVTMLLTSDEE